jgi:hypothetical protein
MFHPYCTVASSLADLHKDLCSFGLLFTKIISNYIVQ